jgi:phosphomevalonate kinase
VIATAPGKLVVTGEFAVLDGAPALAIALDRRVVARRAGRARGSSPFLAAVADAIAAAGGDGASVDGIAVDSSALYGDHKLGLGSSAAVTVAATALALGTADVSAVLPIATAAHAAAQAQRGARGSGVDVAAATYGGAIVFEAGRVQRTSWPRGVALIPFAIDGASPADTAALVRWVALARAGARARVDAALAAIAGASRAACDACAMRSPELAATGLVAALALASRAIDQLAAASGAALVPPQVVAARDAMAELGGTAKTCGAGGGDVALAVVPAAEDRAVAERWLVECGCRPLPLAIDLVGVDLRPDEQ